MLLDFIQFINDNANLTAAKKTALLDDFCEQYGYQETIENPQDPDGDPIPNPVSKKDFANQKITDYLVQSINAIRKKTAEEAVDFTELTLET
jgi:hypothetical protein